MHNGRNDSAPLIASSLYYCNLAIGAFGLHGWYPFVEHGVLHVFAPTACATRSVPRPGRFVNTVYHTVCNQFSNGDCHLVNGLPATHKATVGYNEGHATILSVVSASQVMTVWTIAILQLFSRFWHPILRNYTQTPGLSVYNEDTAMMQLAYNKRTIAGLTRTSNVQAMGK